MIQGACAFCFEAPHRSLTFSHVELYGLLELPVVEASTAKDLVGWRAEALRTFSASMGAVPGGTTALSHGRPVCSSLIADVGMLQADDKQANTELAPNRRISNATSYRSFGVPTVVPGQNRQGLPAGGRGRDQPVPTTPTA